jgi:nucleotide-binding universal stress UspA family protein
MEIPIASALHRAGDYPLLQRAPRTNERTQLFKRILVPLDGSPRSLEALEVAKRLAQTSHASLVLLHVESWAAPMEAVPFDSGRLEDLVTRLRAEGFDARSLVRFDEPDDGIATIAIYERADLIVLTPHLRSGMDALLHPSVTERMLSRSPAPLLILPEKMLKPTADVETNGLLSDPGACILVPLDTSARAELALSYAIRFARHYDRELVMLSAAPQLVYPFTPPDGLAAPGDAFASGEDANQRYLTTMQQRLATHDGVGARITVTAGRPDSDILQVAETERAG